MDSYLAALQARRGKGVDGSLLGEINDPHGAIDSRLGVGGAGTPGGEGQGTPSVTGKTQFDRNSPTHLDEHTEGAKEGMAASPPASHHSVTHEDEHTEPVGEGQIGRPEPHAQSTGQGEGELHSQIRDHVIGHVSEGEAEQLQGMSRPSLGQRAKMGAMKEKFSPAGDGTRG